MEQSVKGDNLSEDFLSIIKKEFELEGVDLRLYSPLSLAFLGDCVYDLVIRSLLVVPGKRKVESLHKEKSRMVNATAQAQYIKKLKDVLTDEEMEIFKTGRNTKVHSKAKNAGIGDYHNATGYEALLGYLYLKGENERIVELVKLSMEDEER